MLGRHGSTLAALAEATRVSIPAVQEQLSRLGDRLAACGLAAVHDGDEVRLMPLSFAAAAISRVATLEAQLALSSEAVEVLVIVGLLGSPTRRDIGDRRGGEDCEGRLLARMCRRSLLEQARDDSLRGDPNLYLTAVSLGALGYATLDSFQSWCASALGDPTMSGPRPATLRR